jgi:hypothetical protein
MNQAVTRLSQFHIFRRHSVTSAGQLSLRTYINIDDHSFNDQSRMFTYISLA